MRWDLASGERSAAALIVVLAVAGLLAGTGAASAQISPGELSRAHQELEGPLNCLKCHAGKSEDMDGNCVECHGAVGELRRLGRGLHARTGAERCANCHPEHAGRDFQLIAWKEKVPEKFDHVRAGWPLAGKHAGLKCRECHKPAFQDAKLMERSPRKDRSASWLGLATTCGSCHRDPHQGALGSDCASCHGTEVFKPASAFDHAATAYPLTGKHAAVECAKCHLAAGLKLPHDENGKPLPLYKPLAHAECSACHRDPHQGRLGVACAKCHTTEGFRAAAAPGAFDHALTRFPLRGRHRDLKCEACHDPVKAWGKRPAFDRCGACHADAHAGRATLAGKLADCAACHDENGFARSTYTVERHRASAYPLAGKHAAVACRDCHLRKPAGVSADVLGVSGVLLRPGFDRCRDCHVDPHAGQLAGRPEWGDCAACHSVDGFKPSRFGATEHAALRLPLAGRHAEVECAACHGPQRTGLPALPGPEVTGKARVLLALDAVACRDCHRDPHRGRLSPAAGVEASAGGAGAPADSAGCGSCHGADRFRPSRVGVEAHRRYAFPLEGAHQAVPCVACHRELEHGPVGSTLIAASSPMPSIPFDQHRSACRDCHDDPHGAQFAASDAGRERGCRDCHGQDAFRPATRFDHVRDAGFSLEGAHARVACAGCHLSETFPDGVDRVRYRATPRACESCHRDPDGRGGLKPRSGARGGKP